MASRPAIITQRDVTRIVKGFAAAGITAGIVVKDGEVRILPLDEIKDKPKPSSLAGWREARNAGKVGGRA